MQIDRIEVIAEDGSRGVIRRTEIPDLCAAAIRRLQAEREGEPIPASPFDPTFTVLEHVCHRRNSVLLDLISSLFAPEE